MTTCATCKHFHPIEYNGPIDLTNPDRPQGLCRHGPPTVTSLLLPQQGGMAMIDRAVWPTVKRVDGCGAHQPKAAAA